MIYYLSFYNLGNIIKRYIKLLLIYIFIYKLIYKIKSYKNNKYIFSKRYKFFNFLIILNRIIEIYIISLFLIFYILNKFFYFF